MSPNDIVILLKIAVGGEASRNQQAIADALGISQSEISKSLSRSRYAGLIDNSAKVVMKMALMDFLQYGIRYAFPQQPGPVVRGVPTAHSAAPLKELIQSTEIYVWPYGKGTVRGQSIIPLYPAVPEAVLKDELLYEVLALVDALRIGRARERELAVVELKKRLGIGE